jgi:hypothetical protein
MKHVKLFEQFISENKDQDHTYKIVISKMKSADAEKTKSDIADLGLDDISTRLTGGSDDTMTITVSGVDKSALSKAKPAITKAASKGEVKTLELDKAAGEWKEISSSGDEKEEDKEDKKEEFSYSKEDLEKLKEFAEEVSSDILRDSQIDEYIEKGWIDPDNYSPEEMFSYIKDWGEGNKMSADEVIGEFDWETLTIELDLEPCYPNGCPDEDEDEDEDDDEGDYSWDDEEEDEDN